MEFYDSFHSAPVTFFEHFYLFHFYSVKFLVQFRSVPIQSCRMFGKTWSVPLRSYGLNLSVLVLQNFFHTLNLFIFAPGKFAIPVFFFPSWKLLEHLYSSSLLVNFISFSSFSLFEGLERLGFFHFAPNRIGTPLFRSSSFLTNFEVFPYLILFFLE